MKLPPAKIVGAIHGLTEAEVKIIPVVPDVFHRRRGGAGVIRGAGDEREARPGKGVARHHLGGPCRGGRFAHAQVVRPDEELDLHDAPPGVRLCLGRDAEVLPDGNSVCRLRRDDADKWAAGRRQRTTTAGTGGAARLRETVEGPGRTWRLWRVSPRTRPERIREASDVPDRRPIAGARALKP